MIESRLAEVLGRHRLKQHQIAAAAGLRKATVYSLYHQRAARVNLDHVSRVLGAIEKLSGVRYGVGDLFVYVPDPDPDQGA